MNKIHNKKIIYEYAKNSEIQLTISNVIFGKRSCAVYEREVKNNAWGKWKYKGIAKVIKKRNKIFITQLERGIQEEEIKMVLTKYFFCAS